MLHGELDWNIPNIRIAIQFENCFFKSKNPPKLVDKFLRLIKVRKLILPVLYPFDRACESILFEWGRRNFWVGLVSFQSQEKFQKKYENLLKGILFDELLFCEDPMGLSSFLARENYNYYFDTDNAHLVMSGVTGVQFTGWDKDYII